VAQFEFPSPLGDFRRYDIRFKDGKYFQFKSWDNWNSSKFIEQFAFDLQLVGNNLSKLRWVFEQTSLGDKAKIRKLIKKAIENTDNPQIKLIKKDILNKIDVFLKVGFES
jgi:hypothetical protein